MKKKTKNLNVSPKMNKIWLFAVAMVSAAMLCLPGTPAAAAVKVEITASVNADKIGVDDVLIYTLTFKGINNPQEPNLPGLKDFRVAQTSRSSEFRFINGVSTYYTNFIFYLTPLKTGTLSIGRFAFEYDDKEYRTRAFDIQVVKGSVAPPPSSRRRGFPSIFDDKDDPFASPFRRRQQQPQKIDIKIESEVSKRKAVIGEPITLRVLLFARNRIQGINMVNNQSFPGFWQEWFPVPRSINSENRNVGGKIYPVYEIRKAVIFPNRTGEVKIPPLKFEMVVVHDPYSIFSKTRSVFRSTPEVTIQVEDLPPQARGLPVGRFSFKVTADRKEVDINDILTLRAVARTANGNIKTVEVPQFTTSDYYKVFPSKVSRDTDFGRGGGGLTGKVEAEMPVSFKQQGLISFPAISFKYYDPARRQVVTQKSKPFNISVVGKKEKQAAPAETVPHTEIVKTGEDIEFIKKGDVYHQERFLYKSKLFTLLMLVFFLLNLLYFLKIAVYDRFIAGSSVIQKKKLLNRILGELGKVKAYAEIAPLLEDYLKEKTGLGRSEINDRSIQELFQQSGVNDGDIDVFIKIKNQSELSRFSQMADAGEAERQLKHDRKQMMEILKRIDGRLK